MPLTGNAASDAKDTSQDAVLRIENRDIASLRATVMGITPADRVARAQNRIAQQLATPGDHHASRSTLPPGVLIQIDGAGSFYLAPEDLLDTPEQNNLEAQAQQVLNNLNLAISESAESRNLESMLRASAYAAVATLIYVALVWALLKFRLHIERRLLAASQRKIDQLSALSARLIRRERIVGLIRHLVRTLCSLVILLFSYEWLSIVLAQFPWTRVWGEHLNAYLVGVIILLGNAILSALPGLFTAIVISLLARLATRALGGFFDRVQDQSIRLPWLDAELADPTRRLAILAVWLFALAMAYPYLPGAQTEAFKGLSVLIGLMISLGASGLVGQVASGLILTYARIYRKGEFIRIMEYEGSIMEMGMFTTRIRNGMGVELTLPNSLVLNNVTRNYSKAVQGQGFVVDTKVSIGYDTPWRQVHEMLIIAALRTPGVMSTPAPQVFQTALSDFYPEYLLICQAIPTEPRPRAEVINMLHANIQDVFNEYGVQIMSPHYLADPAHEKIVATKDWYQAPARPPHD